MLGRTTFKLNLIRDTDSFSSLHQVSNKKEDLEDSINGKLKDIRIDESNFAMDLKK